MIQFIRSHKKRIVLGILVIVFIVIYKPLLSPPKDADWQEHLKVSSTAEFNGDLVTVRNVRNFRYSPTEADIHSNYYDKTYDLREVEKVWFVAEPFNEATYAAHTFVSFEFKNGDFLAITIEARKTKNQDYSMLKGLLKTYPLMYIAADERDVVLLRANVRKDKVYVYPVKTSSPENARLLLVDMLERMNELVERPAWYNTLFASCTSSIAKHVNNITRGRVSTLSWQLYLTASADELALKSGLLDTDLTIDEAREKYQINKKSEIAGDVANYSTLIRQ